MDSSKRLLLGRFVVGFFVVFGLACGVGYGETFEKTDYSYRAMDIGGLVKGFGHEF